MVQAICRLAGHCSNCYLNVHIFRNDGVFCCILETKCFSQSSLLCFGVHVGNNISSSQMKREFTVDVADIYLDTR